MYLKNLSIIKKSVLTLNLHVILKSVNSFEINFHVLHKKTSHTFKKIFIYFHIEKGKRSVHTFEKP